MAVKHNPAREAELDSRWRQVREEMVAEYYLLSVNGPAEGAKVCTDLSAPEDRKPYFMMLEGVPVIAIERGDGIISGVIGDSMGTADAETREYIDRELAFTGPSRYAYLDRALSDWDSVRGAFDAKMREVTEDLYPKEQFEHLVFKDVLVDDSSIDRAAFYAATRYMSRKELFDISESIRTRVREAFSSGSAASDPEGRRVVEENISIAEREIGRRFDDWNRLGGRLDWRVVNFAAFRNAIEPKDIGRTAEWALHSPAYAAYRDNIPKWINEKCEQFSISTMKFQNLLATPRREHQKSNVNEIRI